MYFGFGTDRVAVLALAESAGAALALLRVSACPNAETAAVVISKAARSRQDNLKLATSERLGDMVFLLEFDTSSKCRVIES